MRIGQCLLTEAMVHSENSNRRRDMEKAIENELSLRDLEAAIGGGGSRTYTMRGDTYVCTDGGCTNTSAPPKGSSLWTWLKAIF
jgi:hypothetical protein